MAKSTNCPADPDGFDHKAFGRRLREVRLTLGLTEEQAAADAGRSVMTWRKYEETGRGYITAAIVQFASVHRIRLDWLFCGDGSPPVPRPKLVWSAGKAQS